MKKNQGGIKIETAEGVETLEITLTSDRLDLPILMSALKAKLKQYKVKKMDVRPLTLSLLIGPEPAEDEVPEKVRRRNADRYPDMPPGQAPKLA